MTSFTIPCPKCLSFSHLGLNSQTTQRNMHVAGLGLKKSQSFGSLVCDSNSIGVQPWEELNLLMQVDLASALSFLVVLSLQRTMAYNSTACLIIVEFMSWRQGSSF
ncbi:uncharacterized protein [Arachis hypogaea]|uniref:uncharacterized protein isoform X2 n=1 Tax=Arachis hypogaea TaxID=3818 RepID=UPI000A2C2FDA|nr:uncharacterized protein LOC112791163 isoform X2 [Arachis hypogaea]